MSKRNKKKNREQKNYHFIKSDNIPEKILDESQKKEVQEDSKDSTNDYVRKDLISFIIISIILLVILALLYFSDFSKALELIEKVIK